MKIEIDVFISDTNEWPISKETAVEDELSGLDAIVQDLVTDAIDIEADVDTTIRWEAHGARRKI